MSRLFGSCKDYDFWTYMMYIVLTIIQSIFQLIVNFVKLFFPQPKQIVGQVALVTGGGQGLGRSIAFKLAAEGCHIAIVDINLKVAKQTVDELKRLGVKAAAYYVRF